MYEASNLIGFLKTVPVKGWSVEEVVGEKDDQRSSLARGVRQVRAVSGETSATSQSRCPGRCGEQRGTRQCANSENVTSRQCRQCQANKSFRKKREGRRKVYIRKHGGKLSERVSDVKKLMKVSNVIVFFFPFPYQWTMTELAGLYCQGTVPLTRKWRTVVPWPRTNTIKTTAIIITNNQK